MTARLLAASARLILLAAAHLPHRYTPRHAAPTTTRRAALHCRRALLACANHGRMTAEQYLAGIGFPEPERYASAFGRTVAKAYRASHGAEPYRGCLADINGRLHRCFGYADVADLYAGALVYKRTAAFLAEQRESGLRELSAA